jgi:mannosyltransferase OCH1-like enzyme
MNIYLLVIIIFIIIIFYVLNKLLAPRENFMSKNECSGANSCSSDTTGGIPKIIIQTWKDNNIPDKYKDDIASIKKMNPDFKYMFFTDKDIENFLKDNYPEYYITFQKLPVIIQKIDFFRYVAIYHYGGFYFDLDMMGMYPIKDLLQYDCVFPVDQNIPSRKCKTNRFRHYCDMDMNFILGQYAFGAKAKNDFIKTLIDKIHNNIDTIIENYETNDFSDKKDYLYLQYIYSSTGPDFVTDVYVEYQPKDTIQILHFEHAQFFGKYAKHKFYGTWKKNDE